jgi:glycine/D-amino acid oxidase-like deaminating enzyme
MSVADAVTTPLWIDQAGPVPIRPPLRGDVDVDVAIVGGGYSGLWTAYYLHQIDPTLRIQIIEKHHCGFGASGRNGGWAVGELAGSFDSYAQRSSHQEALRQSRAVFDAVDEIGRVTHAVGIDCDFHKGGSIRVARNTPQARRQREEIAHEHAIGLTEDDLRLLEPEEARDHMSASRVSSGIFFSHCAALHPAKLAYGLADHLSANGVKIAEATTVTAIDPNGVQTDHGTVRAGVVIRATEAYTRDLAGERRTLLPVYSLMIATEPLTDSVLADIGLSDRPTFSDDRFMVIYGQRTADGRLAFGGRGVPYLWGSKITRSAELHLPSHELLRDTLIDLLPGLGEVQITHRWGGVLGIPRDWIPGLRFDPMTGQGSLGGYVGEGVAASNLAGRTMADLVTGRNTDRTSLPWVGVNARRWEPEPFRWLGVRGGRNIMNRADHIEDTTDREANVAYRVSRLLRGA